MTRLILVCGALCAFATAAAFAADSEERRVHGPMSVEQARSRAIAWAAAKPPSDPAAAQQAELVWKDAANLRGRDLLERVVDTFAAADPGIRELVDFCRGTAARVPAQAELLDRGDADPFARANLGLFYARSLAQRLLYDEALEALAKIDVAQTVDPATYFFYRAVCEHELLQRDAALISIGKLLDDTQDVPASYSDIATLMKYELEQFEEKSLDEVAHKMKDSERRLDLGRGGQRVQKVQDEIVATLDEIIKKLEAQQGGGGGGDGSGGGSNQSDGPAGDSTVKGQTGPGEVDPKDFKKQGGWGELPPKKQAEAQAILNRNFPNHYRDAVEEYFKKLATRRAKPQE